MTTEEKLRELEALAERATQGKWQVWDSCSFRRICLESGEGVVIPVTQRSDGHPDLLARRDDLDYIAALNPEVGKALINYALATLGGKAKRECVEDCSMAEHLFYAIIDLKGALDDR